MTKILIIPRALIIKMRQTEHREGSITFLSFFLWELHFSGFGVRGVIVQIVTLLGYIL